MKNNENKKLKTAIYGGSFDPLHFGHVDIVNNLEKIFDSVVIVPSYISPFKTGAADGATRFKLCKKVLASDKTEISRYEISKKDISYSVDTAAYYAKKTDAQLFWVIGSEELIRLIDWHDIDRLKTLVTFYVVPRPNYAPTDELLNSLKKRKIKIKFAKFNGPDISSTRIKLDMAFGKDNKYMPDAVYGYAVKNGLFNPYAKYVAGLYKHGLKDKRIAHSYRTAIRGAELAKLYGVSVNDAVTACILHDIGKSDNVDLYKDKIDLSEYPAPTVHSPIGAYIAKTEFGVSDEIAHAITVHSTGDENMSVLDEIVYLADKTEDGRSYDSLERIRYLCAYDKNIAMYAAVKEISELRETVDCVYSNRALAYYKALCGDRDIPQLPKRKDASTSELSVLGEIKSNAMRVVPDNSVAHVKEHSRAVRKFIGSGNVELDGIKKIAYAAADEMDLHKAHNISIVSLGDKTIVADYFVIASASSTTAVKALMGYVEDKLTKEFGIDPTKRDVDKEWIALDYGGVIIHIFTDKTREFYNIERLWSDGSNIERYGDR